MIFPAHISEKYLSFFQILKKDNIFALNIMDYEPTSFFF